MVCSMLQAALDFCKWAFKAPEQRAAFVRMQALVGTHLAASSRMTQVGWTCSQLCVCTFPADQCMAELCVSVLLAAMPHTCSCWTTPRAGSCPHKPWRSAHSQWHTAVAQQPSGQVRAAAGWAPA